MDVESIAKQLSIFADEAYDVAKTSILWCGHTATIYYSEYAIPAAEKLSELALFCFSQLQKLVLAGPGKIFALAGGVLFFSITAFKIADRKAYEEDPLTRTVWKTIGITAFLAATALTSIGIFAVSVL